ncbi:MAG TPA: DUF4845 domain-containing protein [Terriglobales bacterium]|nr:DUF4845 domain-containing protein [Terriglobales bacterium]
MKTIKALIALAVVVSAFYVGVKVVPVYFNYYQFQDAIEEEARIQSYTGKTESDMRETVWKKAQQLELPLTSPEQIKVERQGTAVTISTEYTVHIDIPVHPFDLTFAPTTKNKQI